jgi:hypothetical protein
MSKLDQVIDQFAAKLVASSIVQMRRIESAPWIEEFERKLPKALPQSFRSLFTRYSFESFNLCSLTLFGNTGALNVDDFVVASVADKNLCATLSPAGYIQIGRPDTGDYDPICFETKEPRQNREFPIVRIDHEDVLCNWRLKVREQVAPSFFAFVERYLES